MPLPKSVFIKLERAREHLKCLKDEVATRLADFDREGIVREREASTGDWVWVVRASPDSLERVQKISGDYVHNLRSALDHLIYSLSSQPDRRPLPEFPIYETPGPGAGCFHDAGVKKIWSIPIEAKPIVERAQPYNGGNQPLLDIQRLDVIDKHRNLITIPYAIRRTVVRLPELTAGEPDAQGRVVLTGLRGMQFRPGRFKYGDIVTRISGENAPEAVAQTDMKFTYQIAVEEPGVSGEIMAKLAALYTYVEDDLLPKFVPFCQG